ncbi:MAG TPA: class I SAM-dependent methyltransferase [Tepidisphaeraceae bacterium]|jgi:ubiquinone/menaquinone biosynthesis C-methylase UbiE
MTGSTSISGSERTPTIKDRMALWLLKLAKMRRRSFTEPTGDDYAKFYEEFFEEKDIEQYEKDRRLVVRRETINRTLAQYAPPPATVLDVGCGLGDVLSELDPRYTLHGTDYAKFNVGVANRRLAGKAKITQASIYDLPYTSNTFDVALCLEVLEHIEDDARAVREIARVLKPGGILIAAVPYTFYWPEYLRLMGHFRHYTRESFSNLMNNNGLKTETYLPNYPRWHQSYTRRYAFVRAQTMAFGRFFGRKTLYTFKWPWSRDTALDSLAGKLETKRQQDASIDYSKEPTSTFLLARKGAADAG